MSDCYDRMCGEGDGAWWTITREGIALGRAQRLPWALAIVQSISQEDTAQ